MTWTLSIKLVRVVVINVILCASADAGVRMKYLDAILGLDFGRLVPDKDFTLSVLSLIGLFPNLSSTIPCLLVSYNWFRKNLK